ncbi:hypothetical protein HCN44_008594 [Aphidius gifuensis]|uniref:PPM-type phosphatase domain-containing protein n=1 Tax=Aphidius gifuensis TaxID=684658 RepID=A0A834XQS6_APHGI|nr:pyruvate dehydrogenase [acetyl-transferring]-phosphatase 1, mitochondrial [Aphidius gifuensis]KAF7989920.1 hypothetical protein HCN44_008594 [Aphidius gifuensis]
MFNMISLLINHIPKIVNKTTKLDKQTISKCYGSLPRLTPQEVTRILRSNEFTKEFNGPNSIKYYDTNQLSSNNPIEDTRSEARCKLTNGHLLGIFDGHGGGACAQVISKRLPAYIAGCLLPTDSLKKILGVQKHPAKLRDHLLEFYNDNTDFVSNISKLYNESFLSFLKELAEKSGESDFQMEKALQNSFLSLDRDLSDEALRKLSRSDKARTLSVAMSGCVAVVSHIDGPHLHVAGAGDCRAVLGVYAENEGWSAKMMTVEHNSDNREEVERIWSEHPAIEKQTVIRMERLLGQLAPLRAFGDFRYKWNKEIMSNTVVPYYGESAIPPNYYTPPYLTAKPDVVYHRLTPKDKFLILATDGLWDFISPLEAVRLVGEHMSGKVTLSPLTLSRNNIKLSEINQMLLQRTKGLKKKPLDENAATHLLRNALGGTEYGIDHSKISQFLTLSDKIVRMFRDDITITVVYMDSEFLRHCPS